MLFLEQWSAVIWRVAGLRLTAGCPLIIRIHMEISATFLESLHNVVYVLVVPLRPSRCWPDVGDARHY